MMRKSVPPLNTIPVGDPPGIVTTSAFLENADPAASPWYSVYVEVTLFATQNGLVAECVTPHGLTRFGSVINATFG